MPELLDQRYFDAALPNRVAVARRTLRPIALVLLNVDGDASLLTTGVRESDTACRLDDGRFALLLEDTTGDGALLTVDRLRALLPDATVRAGIAAYPADALTAAELVIAAEAAVPTA